MDKLIINLYFYVNPNIYLKYMIIIILLFNCLLINCSIIDIPIDIYDESVFPNPFLLFYNEKDGIRISPNTYLTSSLFWFTFKKIWNQTSIISKDYYITLDEKYNTFKYETSIIFNERKILNNYKILVSNEGIYNRDAGFGLGLHFSDESYSIVHSLYKQKQISHLNFAFYNVIKGMNGHLYIGGVPNNKHTQLQYKGTIKIDESLPTWGFTLTSIKYNDKVYEINQKCIIHSKIDNMIVSDKVYELFYGEMIKDKVEKGICKEITEGKLYRQRKVSCMKKKLEYLGLMEFIFGDVKIKMNVTDLVNDKSEVQIVSNGNPRKYYGYENEGILGISFINKFNYTIFDYEKRTVDIFSDTFSIDIVLKMNRNIKGISLMNIFICLFNLIILFIIH